MSTNSRYLCQNICDAMTPVNLPLVTSALTPSVLTIITVVLLLITLIYIKTISYSYNILMMWWGFVECKMDAVTYLSWVAGTTLKQSLVSVIRSFKGSSSF